MILAPPEPRNGAPEVVAINCGARGATRPRHSQATPRAPRWLSGAPVSPGAEATR